MTRSIGRMWKHREVWSLPILISREACPLILSPDLLVTKKLPFAGYSGVSAGGRMFRRHIVL
jgi:hypothetical protein